MIQQGRKPDFFIVGAPKCGTTAMHNYLRQHPQIFIPENKEPRFFSSDLSHSSSIRREGEYLSLFAEAEDEKRVGEATPSYLYSRVAAEKIGRFRPEASIIVMLRNPVDALYSLHGHRLYHDPGKAEDFGEALREEEQRVSEGFSTPGGVPLLPQVMRYSEQLQRYVDVFGWKNIHVIIYDDFQSDVAEEYRKTLRFLGVDESFHPEFKAVNASKQVHSRALRTLMRNRDHPVQRTLRAALPRKVISYSGGMLSGLNTKHEARQAMHPRLRERLQEEFAPEVERLSELLDRDLSHWSKN